MNGETKSSTIKLGAFVAAGTILLLAALFYMGQQRNMFGNTIPLHAIFADVQGLQPGNSVQFMGTSVGTVKKITILSPAAIRVDMVVEEEVSRFIKVDATAQIGTEGLMGNKIINIKTNSLQSAPVQAGSRLQSSAGMAADSLFQTLQITSVQVLKLAENLTAITDELRQGGGVAGSLLRDTVMAGTLKKTIEQVHASSVQTNVLVSKLSHIAQAVDQGQGALGMLVSDTLIHQDLKEAIKQIKVISRQSAQLSNELLTVSRQLNSGEGMAQTFLRDTAFAGNVEQSMVEIREGAQKFNQNMEALQHNFLLRRYFRKKQSSKSQ